MTITSNQPDMYVTFRDHIRHGNVWTAEVELDNKTQILTENESIYIPNKTKHRLSNHGESELVLIEVQTGDYLGEDDIIRFDDIYGRTNNI